jgi:hypothetical protein
MMPSIKYNTSTFPLSYFNPKSMQNLKLVGISSLTKQNFEYT